MHFFTLCLIAAIFFFFCLLKTFANILDLDTDDRTSILIWIQTIWPSDSFPKSFCWGEKSADDNMKNKIWL